MTGRQIETLDIIKIYITITYQDIANGTYISYGTHSTLVSLVFKKYEKYQSL